MEIVNTITGRCRMCYSCVRNCPAKAIKVVNGQAQVVHELCIACGHCVRVCSQKAKQVESEGERVAAYLAAGKAVACLAPSFVAEFHPVWPGQVVTALKKLGFAAVHEVAYGASLVTRAYQEYLRAEGEGRLGLISTPCPAVVSLVEKLYPRLIPQLLPIVSPMIALGRQLKASKGPDTRVVFIGPCVAKKGEACEEGLAGAVDAVLTFAELKEMLAARGIDAAQLGEIPFDGENPDLGRLYPIGGGLLRSAGIDADVLENRVLVVEGREECLEFLKALNEGKMAPQVVDMLFCKGCISGPMMASDHSPFRRRRLVAEHARQGLERNGARPPLEPVKISLRRDFHNKSARFPHPSEAEIRSILAELGKVNQEDELNCGACGYASCRDKAVAVYQGLAENRMCLPYLITQLQGRNILLQQELKTVRGRFGEIVGHSLPMQEVLRLIERVARTDAPVLIRGESGTGKELVARAIHYNSLRSESPFVSLNCAALPEEVLEGELFGHSGVSREGRFEAAQGGTLFLDEIGDLSLPLQAKLLRVLQEGAISRAGESQPRRVNARVLASTRRNLEEAMRREAFRPDLFYRLNVVSIWLPPLRERRDDVPLLARSFLARCAARQQKRISGIAQEAMDALVRADWQGNVRELENAIERAVILAEGDRVELGDLPRDLRGLAAGAHGWAYTRGMTFKEAVSSYEVQLLLQALEESRGVQARAAEMLGLKRSTLNEMLKRHKLLNSDQAV